MAWVGGDAGAVDERDEGGEEELVVGKPRSSRLGRSDLTLGLMILGALSALGVATLHSSGTPAAHPTGSSAPSALPAAPGTPAVTTDTPGPAEPIAAEPSRCPPTVTCTSIPSVPPAVFDAVDSYLLGARPRSQYSVIQTDPVRLYYRQLTVTSEQVQLIIIVSRADRAAAADSRPTVVAQATGDAAFAYVRIRTPDGFLVQVQFTGPPGQDPPTAQARELAADPRLRVLS